jgi:hypothetical protein
VARCFSTASGPKIITLEMHTPSPNTVVPSRIPLRGRYRSILLSGKTPKRNAKCDIVDSSTQTIELNLRTSAAAIAGSEQTPIAINSKIKRSVRQSKPFHHILAWWNVQNWLSWHIPPRSKDLNVPAQSYGNVLLPARYLCAGIHGTIRSQRRSRLHTRPRTGTLGDGWYARYHPRPSVPIERASQRL